MLYSQFLPNDSLDDDQPPDKPAAEPEKQDSSSVEKVIVAVFIVIEQTVFPEYR